jgi:hypothetical protein
MTKRLLKKLIKPLLLILVVDLGDIKVTAQVVADS